MGQFDFKYDATAEKARAQVVAYMEHVGDRIAEINEGEEKMMKATILLEFLLEELPDVIKENVEKKREQCLQWITFLKEEIKCNEEEEREAYGDSKDGEEDDDIAKLVPLDKDCVESLIEHLRVVSILLRYLADARDVLKWAVEKGDLEYKLKANMLDEAMRFQSKYYWLENNA